MSGTLTRKRTCTSVEVEVDISDLADNGWHHEDDCPGKQPAAIDASRVVTDAIASLHRQAHPSAGADPAMCREEPCRSLPLDVVVRRVSKR